MGRHRRHKVPDSFNTKLEQLLKYGDPPQSEVFVLNVMRSVQREQGTRRVILWVFGLIGALFGLSGAMMLSTPVSQALTSALSFPMMETMQVSLFVTAAAALYVWFMNDDFTLGN
jgi:hypothetical protein